MTITVSGGQKKAKASKMHSSKKTNGGKAKSKAKAKAKGKKGSRKSRSVKK